MGRRAPPVAKLAGLMLLALGGSFHAVLAGPANRSIQAPAQAALSPTSSLTLSIPADLSAVTVTLAALRLRTGRLIAASIVWCLCKWPPVRRVIVPGAVGISNLRKDYYRNPIMAMSTVPVAMRFDAWVDAAGPAHLASG